jgi:pyrroline-5-carboxylate reductase
MTIGLIGAGKMGTSIIKGLVQKGLYQPYQFLVYDVDATKVYELASQGFHTGKSEIDVYTSADVLILAIKPQNFPEVLAKLSPVNPKSNLLILSIAAGIKISYLQNALGSNKKIIRIMPNTPALISQAATVISRSQNVTDQELVIAFNIFDAIGITYEIDEAQMDDVIPANGSLPAYVYYFIQAFMRSSVARGINEELAKKLICQTFIGSAKMALESDRPLDELIKDVCSPGGTTIEGIKVFDAQKLQAIIDEACVACANRSRALGKN